MNILVLKLGGGIVDAPEALIDVADEVKKVVDQGIAVVVVHGGGARLTALTSRLGLEAKMVNGRRVTDRATLEAGVVDVHAFLATPARRTTASAGPKDTTVVTRQTTLDGTASTSADGKPLAYRWSIPQGSPSAGISQGDTATPTVQFSLTRGSYAFELTVTDSAGVSASDRVTVNYQGN